MSRILVTGINSPLGQAVGRRLQAEGHTVVGTVRSSKISMQGLPANELVALDLEDKNSFTNITGAYDAMVHIASISLGTPGDFFEINTAGTGYLIARTQKLGIVRLIYLSSMAVYGEIEDGLINEFSEAKDRSSYGQSKWESELIFASTCGTSEVVVIRPPAIAGQITNYHFLSKVLKKIIAHDATIDLTNPDFEFNNIVHEEVIAEFISALTVKKSIPEYRAVPIGSTDPIPLRQIVEIMAKATNYKGTINWVKPNSPPFRIDSTGAIELGYKPITTRETIDRWMSDAIF